jgi:hypothetical protein
MAMSLLQNICSDGHLNDKYTGLIIEFALSLEEREEAVFSPVLKGYLTALLLESIDDALSDILGTRVREALYDQLERRYRMGRTEIPDRLREFLRVLYETLGVGSEAVGKAIARTMYKKLGWEFIDVRGYRLSDHWEIIKAKAVRDIVNPTETQIAQLTMRKGKVGS